MTELLVAERVAHPFWGARKRLTVLQTKHPRIREWPAPSTVADLLARRGLVQRRRVRRPTTHPGVIPAVADAPKFYGPPILKAGSGRAIKPSSTRSPFRPSSPQENGAHERMHRTLMRQAITPVRQTGTAQQRNVDAFRREYNDERPHEALGQRTPASQYTASPRPYPTRLVTPKYPRHFVVKTITTAGTFRFGKQLIYLANAFTNQRIGIQETDDGLWAIYFHTVLLATLDERDYMMQS